MKELFILLLTGFAFFQCNNEESPCSVPATVRDLTGLDGCRFVFELEDGTRLEPVIPVIFCGTPPQPKEITEDPLYGFDFIDGKKVLIAYEKTGSMSICMVGPTVKITCIREVSIDNSEE